MFERVRRDLKRYFTTESRNGSPGLLEKAAIIAESHALKGVLVYRFGSWIRRTAPPAPVRIPLKIVYRGLDEVVTALWGIHIHSTADIEGGLYISHPLGVLIGQVKMGKDCNVGHGVTIGLRAGGTGTEADGLPTIGDRVFIGPNSFVFGAIKIASGAAIAPLTVVGRNVPPRSLVVGNPMQILKRDYDTTSLIYGTRPLDADG
jgi:serine O-acetyltransferase